MPQVIQFSKYFLAGGENLKRRQAIAAWLFLTPFLLTALFFLVGPLGYALYLSTQTDTLVGGVEFVGIENYITTLGDPVFLEGVFLFLV
jgi:multiple sugar transport system permease protein